MSVLLVEDDRSIALVITAALEAEGFVVAHCDSVVRATSTSPRSKTSCMRYMGRPSAYLAVSIVATVAGLAILPGMGCGGIGLVMIWLDSP